MKTYTLYKVIYKYIKINLNDTIKIVKDIRPVNLLNDNDLINLKDYTLKELSKILNVNYCYLTTKIIDSRTQTIDDAINNIDNYLINNDYIIIKDYI